MQHLRSAIYTVMLFLVTAFFAVVVILLMWLPPEAHYAVPRAWARTNLWLLKYLCRLDYRVEGPVEVGALVRMPFGHQKLDGVVVGVADSTEVPDEKLRTLLGITEVRSTTNQHSLAVVDSPLAAPAAGAEE